MKTLALLFLSTALSASVWAGEPSATSEHAGHGVATASAPMTQASPSFTEGTVKKVDKEAGKMTISHGPLVNLDMPAMTMVFYAKDAAFLNVQPGQKIRFSAENLNGRLTVVVLQAEQ